MLLNFIKRYFFVIVLQVYLVYDSLYGLKGLESLI